MKIFKRGLILFLLLILLLGVGSSFAADADDFNSTADNNVNQELLKADLSEENSFSQDSDVIEVETWDDIQYYSSLNDTNYVLKLKENRNYYPTDVESIDSQVVFKNNVTIIGAEGAYFGDSSPNPRNITYLAMKVAENSGNGITFKNITFKWIGTRYQPDGVFCEMAGNSVNYIENCYFTEICTDIGHSSILHIKLGDAVVTNCTFINCTTDFGCLSVYNPKDDPTKTCVLARMNVSDSYFEGNYAKTEPGCINNCGILVVRNSTFYHNSAFWWAGAIHTHGGANTTIYDSNFTDNVAGWNGGALYTYSYLQIYNTIFIGNNCTTNNGGGAIGACKYLHAPYITIKDSLFKDNANNCWGVDNLSDGTGRGGAISLMDQGSLEVRNTTFIRNSASMGTAICAINGGLQMGSPDVILVGNRFINHTRVGDVLDVRLASGSYLEISDNYYYNNSFEFKKLRLLSDEKVGDDVVIRIDAELKNPNSFESDILNTTSYDIYVDGVYNKTVIGRTFSLNLKDGKTCYVYAVPCISNSITNEIFVGVPKEYVYVSQKSGNDTNDGLNRTTPVKTMAKAVELARTKGNIIIMDGSFSESNLIIDYNLTIAGENNVKFTGNVPLEVQTIFKITNNSDLSLSGITFDNIVFTANTNPYKNKRVILQDSGYLTIDNCTFNKISPNGNTAMVLIEAPNVVVYNSIFTNNNKDSVYVTLIKSDEFLIDNCTFANNIASSSSSTALISTTNTKSGVKGTVTNSIFENNKVKYGCIYFGAKSGVLLTVTDTKFIANTVGATNDHASCIKIEEAPTLRVDECVFKDNINLGTRAAVIYSAGGSGSIFVSNSIILNNSYANNNNAVFSASTANNLKCYKNLDGNWWGNTLENYDVAPAVYASACSNWIVLNMTANAYNLAYDQKALVSIDMYNAVDRVGNSSFVDASKLPSFDLNVVVVNGTAGASEISVVKGMATVDYTLKSYDSGSLTVSYGDINSTINFAWSLIDPEIEIDVENDTYGNPVDINITVSNDTDASKFSLKINNDTYAFSNAITIPKLNVGEYSINLTYAGDAKYNPYTITKLFKIEKATPKLTVNVSDIYYSDSARITVDAGDATGEISIRVDDKTDSKNISSGKAEFIIANLQANNYTVEATYSGDGNYIAGNASADFKVKKHNSTITISNSDIVVGSDVILTFTLKSDASGTVTFDVNGKKENVAVSSGSATYTMKSISRGLYNIAATYNGDAKYLSSQNTTQLDVDRLIPDLNVVVSSVTYGEDAVFAVTLNSDASGTVTVIVDGKNRTAGVNNGKAALNISDLNAGNNKQASIRYSGDNTYKPKEISKTFSVAKAKSEITIDAINIKEGQVANVQITITRGVTGTIKLITPKGTENPNIPRTGLFTRTFEDLAIGQYTVSANYGGDGNYLAASESKTFNVSAWDVPQWPNEGYDVKNNGKSPYSSEANGNVAWVKDIDGSIIGNMAIDSTGNIYITTSNGIYSINAADGSTNWIFNTQDAGGNFSGISISRDVILATKTGDKIYFINQTTGEKYNNNIYQGSSAFAPIVDENGNIYTSGEYYGFESTKLNIIPYKIWQTSTAPISIEIGLHDITSSPVLVNNNTVIFTTANRLMGIELSSKSLFLNVPVVSNSHPVIGQGNSIYIISNGHLLGYNVEGTKIKDIKITGSAGDYISIGENGEVYSINKEGKLFDYSVDEETLIYDFNEPISSRLLTGPDGLLYVGSESGMFYSIYDDGTLSWKVNLNGTISGAPVMDNNGVIYVISENRIIAIDFSRIHPEMFIKTTPEINVGDDLIIDIFELPSDATGSIILSGDISKTFIIQNNTSRISVSNLTAGNYTYAISYSGDKKYESVRFNQTLVVSKLNPKINVTSSNIKAGENLTIKVELPNDITDGTVEISINGNTEVLDVKDGSAVCSISGLKKGTYEYSVYFAGNEKYCEFNQSFTVDVGKTSMDYSVSANDVDYGKVAKIDISNLPDDASGNLTVEIDAKQYSVHVSKSKFTIEIPGLAAGNYTARISYSNDDNYMADTKQVSFAVNRILPIITIHADDISYGENLNVIVNLPSDITGIIVISVDNISKRTDIKNGVSTANISGLTAGLKTIKVEYGGDNNYNSGKLSKTVNVNKIDAEIIILADDINFGEGLSIAINLEKDATGNVELTIGDITKTLDIKDGSATTTVSNLTAGSKSISVKYSGDNNYNIASNVKVINVIGITPTINIVAGDIDYGKQLTVDVTLPESATGSVVLTVDGKTYSQAIENGAARFMIDNLTAGIKNIHAVYTGDGNYNSAYNDTTVNVNKINPSIIISSDDINYGEMLVVKINLNKDAFGNVSVSVGDISQKANIAGGVAVVNISDLTAGKKTIRVSYSGDNNYNSDEMSKTVNVNKVTPQINVKADDIDAGEDLVIDITLTDNAAGDVIAAVGDKSQKATLLNGHATIRISDLNSGNYTVSADYLGDDNFNNVTYSVDVNVRSVAPDFIITAPKEVKAGETPIVTLQLPEDAKGNATIFLDGKEVADVEIINGSAEVSLDALSAGQHAVEIRYSGDGKYSSVSKNVTISCLGKKDVKTFIDIVSEFSHNANDYSAGERGQYLYATLIDSDGNPLANKTVYIVINGPVYEIVTDEYGRAGLQINLAIANTYTYALFFQGDEVYCASYLASCKLSLVKKPTSISASSVTFKLSKKTKTVSVTLKTVKSKYDGKTYLKKGKKITLKVNGKTYTSKINSKGIAKFNINLSKKGKYVAKINFAGDKTYNSCRKSIKITVK